MPTGRSKCFPSLPAGMSATGGSPQDSKNAMIAWNGETRAGTPVGIYLSCFELPEKRPVSLRFRAANGAVWMIAAAAFSDSRVPFRREVYEVEKRGDGCRPFVYDRSVEPGSALDFSFLLDAPAGKYGFVTVRDGHFVFEKNGAPVRFHGGNLTFETCYPDREEAGILAERLARIGYNAVRLHHFDYKLCAGNGPGVNPEALDRLEYLVHACKQRGIYITFDLYTARKGWNGLSGGAYKLAIMLLPEVREEIQDVCPQLVDSCESVHEFALVRRSRIQFDQHPERKHTLIRHGGRRRKDRWPNCTGRHLPTGPPETALMFRGCAQCGVPALSGRSVSELL